MAGLQYKLLYLQVMLNFQLQVLFCLTMSEVFSEDSVHT